MTVTGVLVGAPAIAGDDGRRAARLSVTSDRAGSTLSVVVGPDASGAKLFTRCDARPSLLSGLGVDLGLGVERLLSVERGCDDYALTVDPAVQTR